MSKLSSAYSFHPPPPPRLVNRTKKGDAAHFEKRSLKTAAFPFSVLPSLFCFALRARVSWLHDNDVRSVTITVGVVVVIWFIQIGGVGNIRDGERHTSDVLLDIVLGDGA